MCNLLFNYPYPADLLRTPCGESSLVYAFYRWIMAITWTVFAIIYLLDYSDVNPWWTKAEVWVLGMVVVNNVILAMAVSFEQRQKPGAPSRAVSTHTPWYIRLCVVLNTTTVTCAPMILTIFIVTASDTSTFLQLVMYILLPVYLLLDIFLTGLTFSFKHCLFPFVLISLYFLFTLMYYEMHINEDNIPIYPALDWHNHQDTASAHVLAAIFLVFPVSYILIAIVFWFRVVFYRNCCPSRQQEEDTDLGKIVSA